MAARYLSTLALRASKAAGRTGEQHLIWPRNLSTLEEKASLFQTLNDSQVEGWRRIKAQMWSFAVLQAKQAGKCGQKACSALAKIQETRKTSTLRALKQAVRAYQQGICPWMSSYPQGICPHWPRYLSMDQQGICPSNPSLTSTSNKRDVHAKQGICPHLSKNHLCYQ